MDVSVAKSLLDQFYNAADSYVEGDDPATTFSSCGAVLLASVVAGTRCAATLSRITGLPCDFITAVLLVMEADGHWSSLQFTDLILAVHHHLYNFEKLETVLNEFMAEYWAKMEAYWCDVLEILRGGHLFGGKVQWWLDEEEGLLISQDHQWVN